MTKEEFMTARRFPQWGFVPLLDISKGGRYVHVIDCICPRDNIVYDIFADDNMNFYCYPKNYKKKGVDIL